MAQKVQFTKKVDFDGEWYEVSVKGINWNGEYDVQVVIKNGLGRAIVNRQVQCKRVSTINKLLAPIGVKMA